MFAAFKITRDGETEYWKAQPVRPGLMAKAMQRAYSGSPARCNVETRLLSKPDDDAYFDEERNQWVPVW